MKTYFLFLSLLFVACSGGKKSDATEISPDAVKQLPVLNLAEMIGKSVPDTFTWNSIARKVTFIPLETNARTLLSGSTYPVDVTDEELLMVDGRMNIIYLFDLNGKRITTISRKGNGPGEYVYLTAVVSNQADSTIRVFDNGNQKLITYDQRGNYKHERSTKDMIAGNIKQHPGGGWIEECVFGTSQIVLHSTDLQAEKSYFPADTTLTQREKAAIYLTKPRCKAGSLYLFNNTASDTIYNITRDSCEVFAILKKGSLALPWDEMMRFTNLPPGHSYITGLSIGYIPGLFLLEYAYKEKHFAEIWDETTGQLLSRTNLTRESEFEDFHGIPYMLSSGKSIRISPSLYKEDKLVFIIPSEKLYGEIQGVEEDGNPVVMMLEL